MTAKQIELTRALRLRGFEVGWEERQDGEVRCNLAHRVGNSDVSAYLTFDNPGEVLGVQVHAETERDQWYAGKPALYEALKIGDFEAFAAFVAECKEKGVWSGRRARVRLRA